MVAKPVETGRGHWKRPLLGEHEIGAGKLLVAFLGPPLAWGLHFLTIYFLVALFCTTGWRGAGLSIALATALFAALCAGAGLVAFRRWRERHERQSWVAALTEAEGWDTFFLIMGVLGAVLFTALIIVEALPPLFFPICSERLS